MDGFGLCSRHSAYVGHPDADNYSKHLLTLLAQRRELQTEDIRRLLTDAVSASAVTSASGGFPAVGFAAGNPVGGSSATAAAAPQLPPSLFSGAASATSIDRERRELQAELSLGLESRTQPSMAESCRVAVEGAGKPLAGLNELTALTWHFRARQAEAVVEQRSLMRHTAALRRQHFGHVVGQSLPVEVHRLPPYRRQLDHAGSAWQGNLRPCACERELTMAKDCMQALQLAEADAAARLGRLTSLRCVDDSDWWAALHWSACRLPPGRAAERFFDRLRLLPLSHHHRFPMYEQVSAAALRRDQHAAASGLRVPPRVVTTNSESVQQLEQLFREFDPGELLPQASTTSSESIPMTVTTDNSARHHKAAYEARRVLPRVLARHSRRWPGASAPAAAQPQQHDGGGGSSVASPQGDALTTHGSIATDPLPEAVEPFSDDPACSSRDQIHVVRVMEEHLAALVPSLEGDESAGCQSVLRTLPLEVDEVLKAENDFLNDCNETLVHDRMRSLAEQHVDRWSPFATEEQSVRMTLSLANAPWVSQRLQDKTMEALFVMRFLSTKRNKIKVLHYMNAIVSLQLQLLRDEREEECLAQPFPTTACKDFTCPVSYANGTAGSAGVSTLGGTAGAAPSASAGVAASTVGGITSASTGGGGGGGAAAADADCDVWMDDPEAGVSVRDANGKWILYGFAVDQFKALEVEILRVASYHLEVYAAQVHAGSSSMGRTSGNGATATPAGGTTRGSAQSPPPGAVISALDTIQMVDKFTVLADLWECEAQYCAARHKALLSYYNAYRHATCWGLPDMWGGCSPEVTPFTANTTGSTAGAAAAAPLATSGGAASWEAAGGPWQRVSANSPQPQLLGARRQLRRELIDLTFRRPNLAQEDGYFAERYHSETLAMDLEATLVGQLCGLAARQERQGLAGAYMSAVAAASAAALLNGSAGGGSGGGGAAAVVVSADSLWKPGYNAGIVYGGVLAVGQRGLLQEGATLSAVGAAAAALPAHIRAAVAALAGLHQMRHHVELADLRRAVLQYGVTEMAVLLREEAYRPHAPVERPPKDSMFDSTRGRRDLPPDAPLLRGNWLVASHVADNVEVLRATAVEVEVEPRGALEVFLNKETLIRSLYRGEVLWLVYVVQARALGRRVQYSELHGIDWGQIDAAGNSLKAEMLTEMLQLVEPDDIAPPGASGPGDPDDDLEAGTVRRAPNNGGGGDWRRGRGGNGRLSDGSSSDDGAQKGDVGDNGDRRGSSEGDSPLEEQEDDDEEDEEAAVDAAAEAVATEAVAPKSVMVAVGTRGLLGGVWRSPPLALAEFSTSPAELLNPHSLAGLRCMLRPGEPAHGCLATAVRAQVLRAVALEVSIRHNQVLLDGIIRKLDRRRRILMWRAAALEGVADGEAMDVVVGGPPGAYSPAHHPLSPPTDTGKSRRGGGIAAAGTAAEEAERRAALPPLLREPPGDRLEEYNKQRRSSNSARAWMRRFTQSPQSPSSPPHQQQQQPQQQQPHPLLEALDAAGLEDLRQRRRALTAAAGALYFDINEIKLRLRVQARRSYVQGLLRAKGNDGGPEAEAVVRSETEVNYAAAFLAELLPAASRTQMATAVRELAVLVLGGTGGYGRNWGIHYDADGQLLGPKEDQGPLFQGPDGQAALRAAVLEYGPLWQGLMFQLADKKNDPDPMDWAPASPAVGLPCSIGFVQLPSSMVPIVGSRTSSPAPGAVPTVAARGGAGAMATAAAAGAAPGGAAGNNSSLVRLEALWGLPGQWEVLHGASVHYPPGPMGLSALEKGVAVASLVVDVVRHFLFIASLLAPSSILAMGGDVSGQTAGLSALTRAGVPQTSVVSYNARAPTGAGLYQQSEMRMTAVSSSLLPGALLAPELVKLQARLQYLHRPPGFRPSSGGPALQPSPTQPADDVIVALRRELGLLALQRISAAARVRDTYLMAGEAKRAAWFQTGVLEHLLARSASRITSPAEEAAHGIAAPPPAGLPLPAAFVLRLPDPDRLALHNEVGRLSLALERWLAECRVPAATAPHDALALQEYFLAGMWAHDRLRDALSWRALLMESPESFPFSPPHVSAFLRRYHSPAPPLCTGLCPPKPTVEALQALYGSKVLGQAKALITAAETYVMARATARSAGAVEDDAPAAGGGGGGGREGEGKPAWLANSPAWSSPEARFLEACCLVCKQHLDLQAVQVALLRLHQDCAQLAGLRSLAVNVPAPSVNTINGGIPTTASLATGAAEMLHPHSLPTAAVAVFARKLAARQRRGGPTGDVVEINMDDMLRWLADAMSQLTASARSAMAAAAAASHRERTTLHGLVDALEEAVGSLATDHDTFMRRHEIKVETQVVDRAMSLLLELGQARRCALRNAEDARRAMDTAFTAAQKQYGSHIDELNNQLIVARTNSSIMRSELQKSALEALIEVRREMLNRAFASGTMKMTDEVGRMLALERQLEEQQTEILDLQRSITKVQSWFKMRSSTFLTACMKEVAAARGRTEALEGELWEVRERNEITVDQLTTQLRATQADLEAVSAGAAHNASDLKHALASNKKLLKWKINTAPRIEALKMKMAQITRNREAWQEWVNSKHGLMQHLSSQLMAAHRQQQTLGGVGPADQGPPQRGRSSGGAGSSLSNGNRPGGSGTLLATDSELELIRQQWDLERRQMQQEIARLKNDLSNERLVKNDVFERLLRLEQQYASVAQVPAGASADALAAALNGGEVSSASHVGAAGGGRGSNSNFLFGRSTLSPVQADILSRRYEELKSSHQTVKEENAALRRTLAALKTIAPDLVQSLEFPLLQLGGAAGGSIASGAPVAIPVVSVHGAAAVPDLRGTTAPGLPPVDPASPPPLSLAGNLRPGTAGRLRPINMTLGSRLSVGGGAPSEAPGAAGASGGSTGSGGGSPIRRGIGASGARPPSAATYSLRAVIAPNLGAVPRPRSARPWAGATTATAVSPASVAAPAYPSAATASTAAGGIASVAAPTASAGNSPRTSVNPVELNASRLIGSTARPASARRT